METPEQRIKRLEEDYLYYLDLEPQGRGEEREWWKSMMRAIDLEMRDAIVRQLEAERASERFEEEMPPPLPDADTR